MPGLSSFPDAPPGGFGGGSGGLTEAEVNKLIENRLQFIQYLASSEKPEIPVQGRTYDLTLEYPTVKPKFPAAGLGQSFWLIIHQDGTGGRYIEWPANTIFPAGGPFLASEPAAISVFHFLCEDGVNWLNLPILGVPRSVVNGSGLATLFMGDFSTKDTTQFEEIQQPVGKTRIFTGSDPGGSGFQVGSFELQAADPEAPIGGHRAELISGKRFLEGQTIFFGLRIKRTEGDWAHWQIDWQLHTLSVHPPLTIQYGEIGGKKVIAICPGEAGLSEPYWVFELPEEGGEYIELLLRVKISETVGELEVFRSGVLQTLTNGKTAYTGLNTNKEGYAYDHIGIYRSPEATGTAKVSIANYFILRKVM